MLLKKCSLLMTCTQHLISQGRKISEETALTSVAVADNNNAQSLTYLFWSHSSSSFSSFSSMYFLLLCLSGVKTAKGLLNRFGGVRGIGGCCKEGNVSWTSTA